MTDDLEPRLQRHLARQASGVEPVPDPADLASRITERRRRATRALGVALAFALVAGPIAGWAFARGTEDDVQTLSAAGGGAADESTSGGSGPAPDEYGNPYASYLDYQGNPMELVSDRTTDEGVRLVTRLGAPDDAALNRPDCVPDGLVRVGVTDDDLVGVVVAEVADGSRSFGVTGAAEGRPLWVVIVRTGGGAVEARFPNGTVDQTEPTGGLAVLAAYADEGQPAPDLFDDAIEVSGLDGSSAPVIVTSTFLAGADQCSGADPDDQLAMPEPGEAPADEEAARAAVTETFLTALDGSGEAHPELREQPEVWADSNERFKREQPDYAAMAPEVYAVVDEVVFTAPDRATVRFRLVTDNPSIPAPGERIGEAVLIDGVWKVSIETSCELVGLAGIECDYSL